MEGVCSFHLLPSLDRLLDILSPGLGSDGSLNFAPNLPALLNRFAHPQVHLVWMQLLCLLVLLGGVLSDGMLLALASSPFLGWCHSF